MANAAALTEQLAAAGSDDAAVAEQPALVEELAAAQPTPAAAAEALEAAVNQPVPADPWVMQDPWGGGGGETSNGIQAGMESQTGVLPTGAPSGIEGPDAFHTPTQPAGFGPPMSTANGANQNIPVHTHPAPSLAGMMMPPMPGGATGPSGPATGVSLVSGGPCGPMPGGAPLAGMMGPHTGCIPGGYPPTMMVYPGFGSFGHTMSSPFPMASSPTHCGGQPCGRVPCHGPGGFVGHPHPYPHTPLYGYGVHGTLPHMTPPPTSSVNGSWGYGGTQGSPAASQPHTPEKASAPPSQENESAKRGKSERSNDKKGQGPPDDDDDDGGASSSAPTSEIRSMLRRRLKNEDQGGRPKSSLGSVRIEEFAGDRARYLKWKRTIQAQQCLYGLEGQELAMLVYLSTRREARDVLEQHPISSYTTSGGLHLLWKVLDEAFGENESELFERADRELEKYRRAPGESIAHFLAEMRRLRAQYYRIDPDSKFSDKAWAQKLLQKASLSRREKHDCYYAAGAVYDPLAIEKALRVRCGRVHEDERRTTSFRPSGNKYDGQGHGQGARPPFKKKKVFVKKKMTTTHMVEGEDGSEGEEEDPAEEDEGMAEDEAKEVHYEDKDADEEDEDEPEGEDTEEEVDDGELKEAFAAGWKAKQKTAEARKSRGWKPSGGGSARPKKEKSWEQMKKGSTCSSCGMKGHWKGDPECVNVKNGKDPLHKKTNSVHFTFMVGSEVQCRQCLHFSPATARFCCECGAIMADMVMPEERRKRAAADEEDNWDVVHEHPGRAFTHELSRDTAKVAAKLKAKAAAAPTNMTPQDTHSSASSVRLHGKEVLAALPSMSKTEKKQLHRALLEDELKEADQAWDRAGGLMPEVPMGGYTAPIQESGTPYPAPFPREEPPASSQPVIRPPEGKDKPKPLRERELLDFRRSLYESQCQGDRLTPSGASAAPTEAQARCHHPFDELRWSANAEGHYARCKRCDLKHVIYCSNRHGVLVVTKEHKPPPGVPDEAKVWIREDKMAKYTKLVNPGGPDWAQVCCRVTKDTRGEVLETTMIDHGVSPEDLKTRIEGPPRDILTEFWYVSVNRSAIYNEAAEFIRAQTPGLAIADSGCRNAVGGTHWHHHYQKMLDEHQIPWSKIPEREVYKFGAGAPIVSHEACLYPVKIHGKMDIVRMSVVGEGGQACPGLIGPGELSRWGAVFRFADRKLELNGEARPMQLTATRHPGINLLEDAHRDTEELKKFWHSAQGQEKRDVLAKSPQTYAFLTKTEDQESSEEDEASSDPEEDGTLGGMEGREAKVGEWMSKLSQDLGIVEIPTVTTDKTSNTEEEAAQADSEEEATGDSDGSSSHELGVEILTEESSDEEQAEQETEERHAFISQHKKKEMHKSIRKKLGHCMNEIKSQYQDEGIKARTRKERICQKELARETVAPARPRKRWTALEVFFTWTCAISIAAAVSGWEVQEPVTLPRWNLLDEKDYNQALEYIHKVDPDLLVIAWPCTVWSPLQSFGKKTPMQRAVLAERRQEQRALLRFVRDAAHDQRKRGDALLGENPHPSLAWKEPLIEEAFEGQATTRCDMCQYGLKIPTGHIRKRTRLRGTEEILARCSRLCDGSHDHAPCLGGVKMEGKWMNVSDFAGGYTSKFAMEVVKGAEEYLQKGRRREVFVEGEQWAEEDLEDEEPEEDEEQQPQCDGEPGEDNHWKLQKVHERLGHPTNETLARMLSLSGATKAMVESAKNLQCPTCHEIAPPGRYMKQRVESRPTTFGTEVRVDLKYLHDVEGLLHVALSAIDAGTSFHMAVLLRNRNAEHVARKMARHWCSLHGIPQAMVLDQGGEFDGMFVGWMESHGIHSKVSGARSAWQHGFAERHGAVMGSACTALIWQYKAKGRQEVKDCLAAAIQAKNMTMTRKGYTPYQLAFGRHPMFPDLLDDEVANNLPLRDSMGIDGEVRRAAEMRAAARAVFMRQDVQDKLRRALKRWPRGEERSFEAGEMVYFYSPAPKATRFKKDGGSWRGAAVVLMRESAQLMERKMSPGVCP